MQSYKDLMGMYCAAIMRGVEIIAMNEGDISKVPVHYGVHQDLLEIINTVTGPLTLLNGNVSILDNELGRYSSEEIEVLEKLQTILCSLPEIDKEIYKNICDE